MLTEQMNGDDRALPTEENNEDDELAEEEEESGHERGRRRKAASATSGGNGRKPSGGKPITLGSIDYRFPPISCLRENPNPGPTVSEDELKFTARMLRETLETFGVKVHDDIEFYPGPVITRYEVKPAAGVKVNQILNLSDDLALALKAKRIRIIAPIPGKAAVGIEIPNRKAQIVHLRDILQSDAFTKPGLRLPLALGKTIAGQPYVTDLAKLPHLLIAGATGSGKSVCINVLVSSLIYKLHPHQIRFIMIDPKMLELTVYKGIPHLGRPVVTNPKRAEKVLSDAVVEMEQRYRKLANASVRNIEDYNRKQTDDEKKLPYIVIMVDELADLLMSSQSSKTELLITRLAQMARAVGIHLVLATQRPSVDVITGLIKANFPARIAFQVSSKVDSRTIIDANGAEKLLGSGDMLFLHPGQPEPMRLHGAYITGEETENIVGMIKEQDLPMLTLENISQATGETTDVEEMDFGDPLFREACEVVIRHKQGSVSLLQRRLGIGYQRAARLIDKLEQAGIVSPFDGSKAREVLVDKSFLETLFTSGDSVPAGNQEAN
jgi:S-DNA-T family DNA segregation ATPase FtsK/SpoIIIE